MPVDAASLNTERAAAIGGPSTGWFLPEELAQLAIWAQHHERIVELGSHVGQSARCFGDNTRGVVIAVDSWEGDYNGVGDRLELFRKNCADLIDLGGPAAPKVIVVVNSHEEFERKQQATFPDMVFVDGDHRYEAVRRDVAWALSVVQSGGLICGHDVEIKDVRRAIDELLPGWTRPCGHLWARER